MTGTVAATSPETQHCHLCQQPCDSDVLQDTQGNQFCCVGCQTVYSILENDPELQFKEIGNSSRFQYLDLPEIAEQLLVFQSGQFARVRFHLPNIHCSSCVYLLEQLPQYYPNIVQSRINFPKKEADILFKKELPLSQLVQLLCVLGYEPSINLGVDHKKTKKKSSIGKKIAVAGFCFGNTMLLSLPEYLDTNFLLDAQFQWLFRVLNLILTLPVLFYSAQDYFKSAWGGLSKGHFTIDVPIVLGILTLFARTLYEVSTGIGAGYSDSLTGLVFLLLIGKWYQQKTYEALSFDRDFKSYFPIAVSKLVDGKEAPTHVKDLNSGDLVSLHHQELVPCDAFLETDQANMDYSFVSGESEPVLVRKGELLYAGGRNLGSRIELKVEKPVDMSYLTSLWNHEDLKSEDAFFQNLTDRISRYFTFVVLALALGSGTYWYLADQEMVWKVVASVLIVACPCALALALPFAYGHALRVLGYHGIYLKNANVVEKLSRITTLIFDKTGTLTYQTAKQVDFIGDLSPFELELVDALIRQSAHPLSRMIHESLKSPADHPVSNFEEVIGKGLKGEVLGKSIRVGAASFLGADHTDDVNQARVYVSVQGVVRGYFRIDHNYRSGLSKVLETLHKAYRLLLLSGDRPTNGEVLTSNFDELHFQLKPVEKLDFVRKEAHSGNKVAMVGDGLNDAGALRKSEVGIAVADDVHQFSPACDAILDSKQFEKLPKFFRFAGKIQGVVKVAFICSFLYNIVGLSFAISGHLSPLVSAILMPVSSISVVGLVVLMVNHAEGKTLKSTPQTTS